MAKKELTGGFSAIEALIIIAVVAVVGAGGWLVWRHNYQSKKTATTSGSTTTQKPVKQSVPVQTADPYADWKTYTDTGYSGASGVSVKYPTSWQVNVGKSKEFAWVIEQNSAPQTSIDVRISYLDTSKTAQEEWDNCPSADACGPAPGDTKLEANASPINGLDSYSVKMQNSSGVYYVTVIKSNKASGNTTTFVEFLLYGDDASTLSTYRQIVASTTFPS